jgi:hypothetical protein
MVYPNPTTGALTIEYKSATDGTIELHVFDVTGKLMQVQSNSAFAGTNTYHLDLNSLNSGIYLLEIKNGNEVTHSKLMIQR